MPHAQNRRISTRITETVAVVRKFMTLRGLGLAAAIGIATLALGASIAPGRCGGDDPFDVIRGKMARLGHDVLYRWLQRIACSAQYTGTASTGLVIACKSSISEITLERAAICQWWQPARHRRKRPTRRDWLGFWPGHRNRIRFYIGGYVLGTMTVNYKQEPPAGEIATKGIPLKDPDNRDEEAVSQKP
ncbi:MAG: hypothetical protein R3D29_15675 [Nitratireductor sp.]